MILSLLAGVVAGAATLPISPPPADTVRLTLPQVIARALASYPTVGVARAQRDRAAADRRDALSAWLPRLALDLSLNRFELPMVVQPLHGFDPRNPPLFDRTLVQSGLSLSYTLLDFGTRANRVRAQRSLEGAAEAALDGTELQLMSRAVNGYLRVLSTREVLAAEDQRLAALEAVSARTQQFLAAGKAARVDGLRVDAEVKRARADRIAGAADVEMAEHELAQLAGLDYQAVRAAALAPLRLGDTLWATDTTAATRAALVAWAREASPQVLELGRRAQAARAAAGAARGTRFPEVRLTTAYVDRGRAWGDFSAEWQVGVGVSYPLYTGGSRSSAIHRAEADQRAAEEQLRVAELSVEQGVDRALAAAREARARVAALESAVAQSADVVRIERLALEVGSGTQTQYLDAEANLLRARAGLIEARHAEISARVELARLLGELSPDWLERTVESPT